MVFAHEIAGNRGYNGGMGVYTMLCTRHACESYVVFQFIPFETPPHLSLNHYLTHHQKIQATHPIPPTLQPNPLLPTHSLHKIPTIPPSPSKNKKIPHCLGTYPSTNNLTTKSRPPLPPTIHPSTQPLFELSSSPILPPSPPSPFASSLNPLYHPPPELPYPLIPSNHSPLPTTIYCSNPNNQTHHPRIPAPDHFNPFTNHTSIRIKPPLTYGIELPHFRVIKANKYQITGSVGRWE